MACRTARSGSRARLIAGILGIACALASSTALATEGEDFRIAQEAYQRADYVRAAQLFERMVGGETPAIRDRVLIRDSRVYLAAAYVLTERQDEASRQFEVLLRAEGPERFVLDPTVWPDEVQTVFRSVRDRLLEEQRERREGEDAEAAAREQRRREAALRVLELAQADEIEVAHDPAIAWAPFGAGQFQNGNSELGAMFAVTEALALGLAIGTLAAWVALNDIREASRGLGDESGISIGLLRGLQITNWISAGAFAALAGVGIIEAHVNFVPSHRERREREVPPEVLEGLDLSIGPTSIDLRLRF